MKTQRYYQVRFVVRLLFWIGVFTAIMWGVNHINWMGDHYCFKSMTECYFGEGE